MFNRREQISNIFRHIKMKFSVCKSTVLILLTHYATAHFEGFVLANERTLLMIAA
jgi:hypothetical protein